MQGVELTPKRLEILKTIAPRLRRVWAIYAHDDLQSAAAARSARDAASRFRLEVVPRPARTADEAAAVVRSARAGDGYLVPMSPALDIPGQIAEVSLAARLRRSSRPRSGPSTAPS